jgi:TRAP-type C4-dicarboxylate transport system substrate-binding protein
MKRIARVLVLLVILSGEVAAQAGRTLKMQASWPSTVTTWDNFRFLAERLDKTTAGAIKAAVLFTGAPGGPYGMDMVAVRR